MEVRDKIYINGSWVPSTGNGTLEVIDSTTEEVMATIPDGTVEDVDKAVQAAAAAFPAWSATSREERAKTLVRIGEALAARTDEIATIISHEVGMPMTLSGGVQVGLPAGAFADAAKAAESLPLGRGDRELAGGARAGRRGRRHHPVELPALPDRPQGRPGPGRRLHGGAQAQRGRTPQRLRPGRGHRRGRAARRRLQPGHRGRAGGGRGHRRRTPRSTWCRSPARPGPASGSWSWRRRASRGSRSSWAGSRPTSCWTTPTSRRRSRPACSAAT